MLKGKNIVICVCGGIAAYKVVEVASRFKKLNAVVKVIMIESAMYENPIVQNNIEVLKKYRYKFIEPAVGTMAMNSELSGKGRLPEPKDIVDIIAQINI